MNIIEDLIALDECNEKINRLNRGELTDEERKRADVISEAAKTYFTERIENAGEALLKGLITVDEYLTVVKADIADGLTLGLHSAYAE